MLEVEIKQNEKEKLIVIDEDEGDEGDEPEINTDNMTFIDMVHHIMKPLKGLPLDDIKSFIQSEEMREEHDNLVDEFYSIFPSINKDDDSLDTAIALQGYGFNLRRVEEDKDELELEKEIDGLEILTLERS